MLGKKFLDKDLADLEIGFIAALFKLYVECGWNKKMRLGDCNDTLLLWVRLISGLGQVLPFSVALVPWQKAYLSPSFLLRFVNNCCYMIVA